MDIAQYLPMFMAEAREHLQELNLAVVRVEETPDDRETVDEIFRIAHSLKGMSATMGFEGMASLTHHMEDVFELLKQRRGGLDRAAIDVLLECLDALEAAVDSIEADGTEHLDPAALNDRLQALVRAPRAASPAPPRPPGPRPPRSPPRGAAGARVVHVSATLTEDTLMPSVRAYMVLAAIAEHGELVASVPHHDDVEGFDGRDDRGVARVRPRGRRADRHRHRRRDVATATSPTVAGAPRRSPRRPPRRPSPPRRRARRGAAGAAGRARAAAAPKKAAATVRVDAERLDAAHALHGRARRPPHARRVARRRGRRPGPEPGDAGSHPLLAGAAGDGHAGPDDPGRRRLHALPAPRPRPVVQARQGRRARARRQGHRARPHRRRGARRPARPPRSATRSTTASSRPTSAPRRASRRPARSRSPPATPAATSSSTSATTGAASTRPRSAPRRSSAG